MHGRPCYEVEFSDGSVIVADEQHQWLVSLDGADRLGPHDRRDQRMPLGSVASSRVARMPGSGVTPAGRGAVEGRADHAGGVGARCAASRWTATDHLYLAGGAMIPTHNSTIGSRHRAVGGDQAQDGRRRLLARDEPHRDHHAAALGRGRHPAAAHAQGHDARRGLDPPRPDDGRGLATRRSSSTTRPTCR